MEKCRDRFVEKENRKYGKNDSSWIVDGGAVRCSRLFYSKVNEKVKLKKDLCVPSIFLKILRKRQWILLFLRLHSMFI